MHSAPSGLEAVETVIDKTFFDPSFGPEVVLGPEALEFVAEFGGRHSASLDAVTTILQVRLPSPPFPSILTPEM